MSREEFLRRLGEARTHWAAVVVLLERWRSHLPEHPAWLSDDQPYERWSALVHTTERHFAAPDQLEGNGALTDVDRQRIRGWTKDGDDLDAVHAVATGIDVVSSLTFASAWRDDLCTDGERVHRLQPGQLFPAADPPWAMGDGVGLSSRPSSMTAARVDELPHVRAFSSEEFEVWIDFRFDEELDAIVRNAETVATLHPNLTLGEFDLRSKSTHLVFPVLPRDVRLQKQRVLALVDSAVAHGARIVVLPELSTTPEIVDAIRDRLATAEQNVLVVAGSCHVTTSGIDANEARGLLPDIPESLAHTKLVPFRDELRLQPPSKEGIAYRRPARLTVYSAREFRLSFAICRDFLDAGVVTTLDHLAANVICVPAMSQKTRPFVTSALTRVQRSQALTVVANGPTHWDAEAPSDQPAAVLTRPLDGEATTTVSGTTLVPPHVVFIETGLNGDRTSD
jgi:hypothetical protein